MTDKDSETTGTVEEAMNQVLEAERAAEEAIADCRQEAQQILQAARERAQRIAERTDERLAHCHMRCSAKLARELKERERTEKAELQGQSSYQLDADALAEVVEAVAAKLTVTARSAGDEGDADG